MLTERERKKMMAKIPDGWLVITHVDRKGIKIDMEMKELVMCKNCKHRDPEDRKCDCGGMPWNTQAFPVPDDWFCPYGEKEDYQSKKCRECELTEAEKMYECQLCRQR